MKTFKVEHKYTEGGPDDPFCRPANAAPLSAQYSPAPWAMAETNDPLVRSIFLAEHPEISVGQAHGETVEQCYANACLIVAAPKLISALRGLVTSELNIDHEHNRTPHRLEMRKAIWLLIEEAEASWLKTHRFRS